MRHLPFRQKNGFSLIELLVVMAIIGLLSAIVVSSTARARAKARDTKRLSDLRQLGAGLEFYYQEYGNVPNAVDYLAPEDTSTGFSTPGSCGVSNDWSATTDLLPIKNKGYISSLLIDPVNKRDPVNINSYCYHYEPHDDSATGGGSTGVGACLWATLEEKVGADNHNKKVGIVVGNPLNTGNLEYQVSTSLFKKFPIGYECGTLDELLQGTNGVDPIVGP